MRWFQQRVVVRHRSPRRPVQRGCPDRGLNPWRYRRGRCSRGSPVGRAEGLSWRPRDDLEAVGFSRVMALISVHHQRTGQRCTAKDGLGACKGDKAASIFEGSMPLSSVGLDQHWRRARVALMLARSDGWVLDGAISSPPRCRALRISNQRAPARCRSRWSGRTPQWHGAGFFKARHPHGR